MLPDTRPFLVLGATGTTGSRVVDALARRGATVRAATRRVTAPAAAEAEWIGFDWDDPATHDGALEGVGGIYLVPPPGADPAAIVLPFLRRAVDAGVQRVVVASASSVESGGPLAGAIHAALPDTGLGWAVTRPSWFQQNAWNPAHHLGAAALRGDDLVSATGSGRVGLVDAADIAAVAATLLTGDTMPDRDVVITGPETLDYAELADRLSAALGRTVRHRAVTERESAHAMVAFGYDRALAETLAAMEAAIATGVEDRVSDGVERITGRPPRAVVDTLAAELAAGAVATAAPRRPAAEDGTLGAASDARSDRALGPSAATQVAR